MDFDKQLVASCQPEAQVMDDDDRADLIRRLFAVMTMMLEDAAATAVEGQGWRDPATYSHLAERLHGAGGQIAVIAEATAALFQK